MRLLSTWWYTPVILKFLIVNYIDIQAFQPDKMQLIKRLQSQFKLQPQIRSTNYSVNTQATTTTTTATMKTKTMSWDEFFKYKNRLIWFKRIAGGIPATMAFLTVEGTILSLPIFDPTQPILGLDPLVIVGAGTALGILGSFIAGSSTLGHAWRLFRPNLAAQLDSHQRDFYARITKYRANVPPNPTQMNFSFDFYGEKIASVKDYRIWLRRQREMINERKFKI